MVAKGKVYEALAIAASCRVHLGTEPLQHLVVQTDGDPGLAMSCGHHSPRLPLSSTRTTVDIYQRDSLAWEDLEGAGREGLYMEG